MSTKQSSDKVKLKSPREDGKIRATTKSAEKTPKRATRKAKSETPEEREERINKVMKGINKRHRKREASKPPPERISRAASISNENNFDANDCITKKFLCSSPEARARMSANVASATDDERRKNKRQKAESSYVLGKAKKKEYSLDSQALMARIFDDSP